VQREGFSRAASRARVPHVPEYSGIGKRIMQILRAQRRPLYDTPRRHVAMDDIYSMNPRASDTMGI